MRRRPDNGWRWRSSQFGFGLGLCRTGVGNAAGGRQRFSCRSVLPFPERNPEKNQVSVKKKLAFRNQQRHNVSSPGEPLSCRRVACILPGLPSFRGRSRLGQVARAWRVGSGPHHRSPAGSPCAAGLARALNHTVGTPNDGPVPPHRLPAFAGSWIGLTEGIAKEP
jgi:hypothetical protein